MKFKVSCPKVLSCALTPSAVVVATLRARGAVAHYVLLSGEERDALRSMGASLSRDTAWREIPDPKSSYPLGDCIGPPALRTHAFDVETGIGIGGADPFDAAAQKWTSAEHLWINGAKNEECPAPNWRTWTAIRKLRIAAAMG